MRLASLGTQQSFSRLRPKGSGEETLRSTLKGQECTKTKEIPQNSVLTNLLQSNFILFFYSYSIYLYFIILNTFFFCYTPFTFPFFVHVFSPSFLLIVIIHIQFVYSLKSRPHSHPSIISDFFFFLFSIFLQLTTTKTHKFLKD